MEMDVNEVDVKHAVKIAREQAQQLFENTALNNLALEEVEFDDTLNQWLITLGYDSPCIIRRKTGPSMFQTVEEERKREYKVFRIDGHKGNFISMKIRDV